MYDLKIKETNQSKLSLRDDLPKISNADIIVVAKRQISTHCKTVSIANDCTCSPMVKVPLLIVARFINPIQVFHTKYQLPYIFMSVCVCVCVFRTHNTRNGTRFIVHVAMPDYQDRNPEGKYRYAEITGKQVFCYEVLPSWFIYAWQCVL